MRLTALCLGVLPLLGCQAAPNSPSPILPLRSVRLYETGVGYFERSGHATSGTGLPLPAGHLDDALKTLVVLGDGHVQGLQFKSSVSKGMARALAGLPTAPDGDPAGESISYRDLLSSLKGATVEISTDKETLSGRLVDVLSPTPPADEKAAAVAATREPPELTLLLLTARAEVRRLRSGSVRSVRPTDPLLQSRLASSLEALSGRGAQAGRLLQLLASAPQGSPVTLGYVAETPVWRTTYRLVFSTARSDAERRPSTGKRGAEAGQASGTGATLQAWALLHNDADEDWHSVRVDLVNGRPDSFLFPLSAPRYARRELQHPEDDLSTVPQLLDTTVDALWGDKVGETVGLGGVGTVGYGSGGGGAGYGRSVSHGATASGEGQSSLLEVGNLAEAAQAKGVEAGALFSYTLAEPLTLSAHATALVPFLQSALDAAPITWMNGVGQPARSAVLFHNSTRQTLPAGPISIFASGGFAGEAVLDRLKPGERRFLQYGTDLDVDLEQVRTESTDEPKRLVFVTGALQEHFLRHGTQVLRLRTRGGAGRNLYLGLKLARNAQVSGADGLDYDLNAQLPVAVFTLPPRADKEYTLKTTEGLSRRTELAALTAEQLGGLAARAELPQADRTAAGEAAGRQRELEQRRGEVAAVKADMQKVDTDLTRLREHLKAQGGGQAAAQSPFVRRILDGEDRLGLLRKRVATLEAEAEQQQGAVRAALERLQR